MAPWRRPRWRRGSDGHERSGTADVLRLLVEAVDELDDDLSIEERAIFANLGDALAQQAVPDAHIVTALKALGGRAAETDRSALHVRLFAAATALDAADASLPYDLGNHLTRLGRAEEAVAAYGEALRRDPGLSLARYNRGRVRYDAGDVDGGLDDFTVAIEAGCDVEGFHYSVGKRFITERGFRSVLQLASDDALAAEQQFAFLQALVQLIDEATAYGGWLLGSPVAVEDGDAIATVIGRSELADILRESPIAMLLGGVHMARSDEGYDARILEEHDVAEALWYRPERWRADEPEPDRVDHLERLDELVEWAQEAGAPEVAWAAHYMAGAIVLSTLFDAGRDWPSPVARLAVPRVPGTSFAPRADLVDAVDRWIVAHQPETVGYRRTERLAGYAAARFRAAATILLEMRRGRREPPPGDMLLVDDAGAPVMVDGQWATGSMAGTVAAELWSAAEPVFRDWVTSAGVLGGDIAEHAAGTTRARQFNILTATELWSHLPADEWGTRRDRIVDAYDAEPSLDVVREALRPSGLLIDTYVHEIVEDTVVQLLLGATGAEIAERRVDVLVGELGELLNAHRPGEIPPEGLSGRVDELLLGRARPWLEHADTVVLVPFGYLRNVPFHALTSLRDSAAGQPMTVAYLPSASFISRLDHRPVTPGRVLFVGFDPTEEVDVDAELDILQQHVGNVTVLRDEQATPQAVLDALAAHDTVHFACHGDADDRVRAGYLELAGGRLSPWDLLDGRPVPSTVVLNACLTNRTGVFEPTSDETFGLHTAFLTAGSARVVGGLWEINEWSAQHFAEQFYREWISGQPPAAAVAVAHQALQGQTADPFLWAPHAFFGDWR